MPTPPVAPPEEAPDRTEANCGECRNGVDICERDKVVCSVHLDFRLRKGGQDCVHFSWKRSKPRTPQLVAESATNDPPDK